MYEDGMADLLITLIALAVLWIVVLYGVVGMVFTGIVYGIIKYLKHNRGEK